MTGVSEQGRSGLLWTIFEGEPFCSRRIASFGTEQDARDYMNLTRERDALAAHVARLREALSQIGGVLETEDVKTVIQWAQEALTETPAASLDAVIGPTVELLGHLDRIAFRDCNPMAREVKTELTRLQKMRERG